MIKEEMNIKPQKKTSVRMNSQNTNTESRTYMTSKYVTELLLSQHIITRGEHLPHILSILQLVSFETEKRLGIDRYNLFLYWYMELLNYMYKIKNMSASE